MSAPDPILKPADDDLPTLPVLIVDDSRAQRRLLTRTLARWGYDTIEASSGEEALEICSGVDIELVVSDWLMPGMSGVEFCRAFRELKHQRPAYFILLTAQTERERLAEGLESGADDFVSKPFNVVELKARLRAGVRVISAQREMISKNLMLQRALGELEEAHAAKDRDLREARSFQQALVPERHISLPGVDISFLYRPSGHVGGDLVGMFRIRENRYGIYAIDVAGHGIASALMTARVAGHLNASSPEQNVAMTIDAAGLYAMHPPHEVCRRLNRRLIEEFELDKYLTMIIAEIDLSSGRIVMSQAGHPSPLLQRSDGSHSFLTSYGLPVGLIEDAEYTSQEVVLNDGDRLILYSDGLTECPDRDGVFLDEDGFAALVKCNETQRGAKFVSSLQKGLIAFSGTEDFPDDLSAVVIEKTSPSEYQPASP